VRSIRNLAIILATAALGCSAEPTAIPLPLPIESLDASIRVVNAGLGTITFSVDGAASLDVAPASIYTLRVQAGSHSVKVNQASDGASVTVPVSVLSGAYANLAAQKVPSGTFTANVLADTGAIPAPGMGKLRVLHLAVNAGKLDIWRTQPDYQTPITFMFPFNYGANTGFMQSTPGVWNVRVWKSTPGKDYDVAGWNSPLDQLEVQVSAAWIRTVMVLDSPGGGVKLKVLE